MKTQNWKNYPFTVDGVNFNSKVDINSETGKRAKLVPETIFQNMNIGAVRELVGDVKTMSRNEILETLEFINAGSSWAVIELV